MKNWGWKEIFTRSPGQRRRGLCPAMWLWRLVKKLNINWWPTRGKSSSWPKAVCRKFSATKNMRLSKKLIQKIYSDLLMSRYFRILRIRKTLFRWRRENLSPRTKAPVSCISRRPLATTITKLGKEKKSAGLGL